MGPETLLTDQQEVILKRVIVQTDGNLSDAQIIEWAGVEIGKSAAGLDAKLIQAELNRISLVKTAKVNRPQADQLAIKIEERVAIAWLSCPDHEIRPLRDGGLLLDKEAVAFKCEVMAPKLAILPTIEIKGIQKPLPGSVVESFQVAESLKLIQANNILFYGQGRDIIDVRALKNWGLLCRYTDEITVTFDPNRIEAGLHDLAEIFRKSKQNDVSLATVNLVTVKNIPVTFRNEIDAKKWQNNTATEKQSRVNSINEIQEKHLRAILRGG